MDRLAELRDTHALTLRELSEMSGVAADTINQIELGHRKARPSTLRKLARALDVEVRELFEEPALPKDKAPDPGPSLLERGQEAARRDAERESRAIARLHASEGLPQSASEYEEDKYRAELRRLGFPDEHFETFIWPLVVENMQLREENTVLREQLQEHERAHS